MWFHLDLSGIKLTLRINGYEASSKDKWDYQWCDVDFSFVSEPWLKYQRENDEVLLSCEIEELAHSLDALLKDQLTDSKTIECIEPDFKFILQPVRDLRKEPKYLFIKEGCEFADIYMDMKVYFWNDGLTDNYLSVTFGREDIQHLRNYLFLIIGQKDIKDSNIAAMIENGILAE